MRSHRSAARHTSWTLILGFLGLLLVSNPGRAQPPLNVVQQWNVIAEDTIVPKAFQNEGLIYMAYVSAAMYDAAVAIRGGYEPYGFDAACPAPGSRSHKPARFEPNVPPGASLDAAVVAAAYWTLRYYFSSDAAALDLKYAQSLAAIPDSALAKSGGVSVGTAVAEQLICLRADDGRLGLKATSSFERRPPGPGVWRLTPPYDAPQTPWVGSVTPFVLHGVNQFHPAPPPPLQSAKWIEQFNEVRDFGGNTNTNTAQRTTAQFWVANVIRQYNRLGRDLATERGLDVLETARWLAIINMVGADAQIAVMHWKYTFLFWRPVTAIDPCSVTNDGFGPAACNPRDLDTDDNPATLEHVGWRPLLPTPNHPEYPGAHGSITGAMAEVLTWFRGTDQIDVDIHGTTALTAVRHFDTAEQLLEEIVNARVWGGLHYRGSTEAGVKLGQQVAHFDLHHAFGREHNRGVVGGFPGQDRHFPSRGSASDSSGKRH
jgi:hypothetical protein